jgi:hypothetical protein
VASGAPFLTKEEIDAEIDGLRSDWEDKIDEAYRQLDEEKLRNQQADLPSTSD